MPITIDATWGGSISNVYVSETDATSFLTTTFGSSLWNSLSQDNKHISLLTATRSIDQLNFVGTRYFFFQQLKFPRTLQRPFPIGTQVNTFSVEWVRMIEHVQQATAIQANHMFKLELDQGQDHRFIQSQGINSFSQSSGNTSDSISYGGLAHPLHPDVKALLKEWQGAPRVYRG